MAKVVKLVAKFLRRPSEASLREVEYVLEHFGYTRASTGGKHAAWVKAGHPTFIVTLKKGRHLVRGYIIQRLIDLLNLEEWYEQR